MERSEVSKNLQWKTEDLYESFEAWEAEFAAAEQEYSATDFAIYSGKLADKATLLACFKKTDEVFYRIEKLYLNAHLRQDEDLRSSKYGSASARLLSYYSKLASEFAYVDPELTALSDDTLHNREQVIQLYRSEILRFLELETISNVDLRRIIDHISVNKSGIVHVELKKFDNLVMQS